MSSPCQRLVGGVFPHLPETLGTAFLAQHHVALAMIDVAITQHDMRMRIMSILTLVMNRCEPRTHATGDGGGIVPDQLRALFDGELYGNGDHDFIDHPRVGAVGSLFAIDPIASPCGRRRSFITQDDARRLGAGDIPDVRCRRARYMCLFADAGMVK